MKGHVYTIREFQTDDYGNLGMRFKEIINPVLQYDDGVCEVAFHAIYFRPVKRTDISVFTRLLAPTPELVGG